LPDTKNKPCFVETFKSVKFLTQNCV